MPIMGGAMLEIDYSVNMTHLKDLFDTLNLLFPEHDAHDWDAVGPVCGDPKAEVRNVLLAVDPVEAVVSEAIQLRCDALITHHPLLLRGVTTLREDRYKGHLAAKLIRADCGLYSAHTNADVVEYGPTGTIFDHLGITVDKREPIEASLSSSTRGIGLVGDLPIPTTLKSFAQQIAQLLPVTTVGIRVAGDADTSVQRIACCSGAGDSLLSHPKVTSADVYLTSDLRHHPASEAREQALLMGGPALVDMSHFAGEWLWLEGLAQTLRTKFPTLQVTVSQQNTDPWTFIV